MDKIAQEHRTSSADASPLWEQLEGYAREKIQVFVQQLLEEEVDDLLGRKKSERRTPENSVGYRNGYGKPRRLTFTNGTIELRRPRVRPGCAFCEPRGAAVSPAHAGSRRALAGTVSARVALGDFELALRGL